MALEAAQAQKSFSLEKVSWGRSWAQGREVAASRRSPSQGLGDSPLYWSAWEGSIYSGVRGEVVHTYTPAKTQRGPGTQQGERAGGGTGRCSTAHSQAELTYGSAHCLQGNGPPEPHSKRLPCLGCCELCLDLHQQPPCRSTPRSTPSSLARPSCPPASQPVPPAPCWPPRPQWLGLEELLWCWGAPQRKGLAEAGGASTAQLAKLWEDLQPADSSLPSLPSMWRCQEAWA